MKQFTLQNRKSFIASAIFSALFLVGCQQAVTPTQSSSPEVSVTAEPEASPEPGAIQTDDGAEDLALFKVLTQKYEAEVKDAENGYPIIEPLLSGDLPAGMGDDIYGISLETTEEQVAFDSKLLPVLKDGFSKQNFVPRSELIAGNTEVNYRGLRQLVSLLAMRAEQLWQQGEKKQALALAKLPISLSKAMRQRPETASVNLFSSNYSEATLGLLPDWLESGRLDPDTLQKLSEIIVDGSPDYSHMRETVTVDFAQLMNSLGSEKGRELLGIGQVEDSTLELWKKQLLDIHREAVRLYDEAPLDASPFNESVRQASGPIQGLVIDYPEVATMQKHWFAKYKASELGLALLGPRGEELGKLGSNELIDEVLNDDEETESAVKALLEIKFDQESILVVGKAGQFDLLAPGVEPVFFEHHYDLGLKAQ